MNCVSQECTSPLDIPCMLILGYSSKFDPMTSQVRVRKLGDDYARLPVQDEFLHGTMDPNPAQVNGPRQCLFELVRDQHASMPACASVEHVKDDVLVDKQKVALDLLVEGVGDIHTAHVVWAWSGPHATHLAGVADLRDQVEDCIRDSDSLEKATHYCGGGVPPSHVQLSQRETVSTYSTRPEEPDHSSNIEVGPI